MSHQEVSGGVTSGAFGGGVTYVAIVKSLSSTVAPDETSLHLGPVIDNSGAVSTIHAGSLALTAKREFCFVGADLQVSCRMFSQYA